MAFTTVFRAYAKDDSFTRLEIPGDTIKEFQVVLTSARDYDGKNSTNGNFIPYWDTESVTPQVIANFKNAHRAAKVFVGIGNSNKLFPFRVGVDNTPAWIVNATASLRAIIRDYHLDGIDVHYENIDSTPDDFVQCIGQLITSLKGERVITVASIALDAVTSDGFYSRLYKNYNQHIDNVVYQCFTQFTPKPDNPVASFIIKVQATAQQYRGVRNFLVGHSALKNDSDRISPPLFIGALFQLLGNNTINGASIKVISDSVTSFPPKWIIELLDLASRVSQA